MPYIDKQALIWKEIDGRVTIVLMGSGNFCELNQMGSEIWRLLAQEKSTEQIVDALQPKYQVTRKKLFSDVNAFIKTMLKQGLLKK